MKTYFAFYRIPSATIDEWKKTTDAEKRKQQSQKMMDDMNAWMKKHESDFEGHGWPLEKTKTVTSQGIRDSRNDLAFCQIVKAESHEEAASLFVDCPHLQIPDAFIDITEIPEMGM